MARRSVKRPAVRVRWELEEYTLGTPEGIFDAAALYLRVYLLGYPFLLLFDFGAAILRSRGDRRYPFFALLFSGLANVGLNLVFAAVFRMGVAGVAAATDISTALSALLVLRRLRRDERFRFSLRALRFSPSACRRVLRTGVPSAVQGAVFCFANLFVQASVNRFDETAIAGSTIAMNFEYFTYYIITAFGQTATTFTGQNHAAGQLGCILPTPNAPGQRVFSRCAAPFFLEIRQYSCGKMSCSAQKLLAAGHIGSWKNTP